MRSLVKVVGDVLIVLIVVLTGDATGDMLLSSFNFDPFFRVFAKKSEDMTLRPDLLPFISGYVSRYEACRSGGL
jgi:hypothetical protein